MLRIVKQACEIFRNVQHAFIDAWNAPNAKPHIILEWVYDEQKMN
jgi:hypothetical protein